MMVIRCSIPSINIIYVEIKSLFTRVMVCEHGKVTLLTGEKVVIEAIKEVHLKMHNGIVRKQIERV